MASENELRALLAEARDEMDANANPSWEHRYAPLIKRIDVALAEPVCDDFKRGAEAMREAAASCVGSDTALLQTYRSVLEGRIRDLPVPEDKP